MSEQKIVTLPTDGFVRQLDNGGAIVNVDKNALQAYKLRREAEKRKDNDINILREEVTEVKFMLSQILEKISK
jgi:hypothetical protein